MYHAYRFELFLLHVIMRVSVGNMVGHEFLRYFSFVAVSNAIQYTSPVRFSVRLSTNAPEKYWVASNFITGNMEER